MDKILSKAFNKSVDLELDDMFLEIKERKDYNSIIEDMKNKYKPEELTDDGIPTIETQLKEIAIKDEEYEKKSIENATKIYNREMVQRVKCLSLIKMGLSIFINTNDLSIKQRKTLQAYMWEYNDKDHQDIIKEFNEETSDLLDDVKNIDYSKLPVYDF